MWDSFGFTLVQSSAVEPSNLESDASVRNQKFRIFDSNRRDSKFPNLWLEYRIRVGYSSRFGSNLRDPIALVHRINTKVWISQKWGRIIKSNWEVLWIKILRSIYAEYNPKLFSFLFPRFNFPRPSSQKWSTNIDWISTSTSCLHFGFLHSFKQHNLLWNPGIFDDFNRNPEIRTIHQSHRYNVHWFWVPH